MNEKVPSNPSDSPNMYGNNNSSNPSNMPENHMTWSIINLVVACIICCCTCYSFPSIGTAIAAIVYSNNVSKRYMLQDFDGAQQASNTAKTLNWVSTGITAVLGIVGFIINLLMFDKEQYLKLLEELSKI